LAVGGCGAGFAVAGCVDDRVGGVVEVERLVAGHRLSAERAGCADRCGEERGAAASVRVVVGGALRGVGWAAGAGGDAAADDARSAVHASVLARARTHLRSGLWASRVLTPMS